MLRIVTIVALGLALGARTQSVPPLPSYSTGIPLEAAVEDTGSVSKGDLDGDGDLDLILAKGRHAPILDRVLINDGKGKFRVAGAWGVPAWPTRNATIADFNGDGRPDVAAANRPGPSYVCLNQGGGAFAADCIENPAQSTTTMAAADFDNDGSIDLAVPGRDGSQSYIYFNDGKAGFGRKEPFGAANVTARVAAAADFNWFVNDRTGAQFRPVSFGDAQGVAYGFAIGDVNGDGVPDIGMARSGATNVLFFGGLGSAPMPAQDARKDTNPPAVFTDPDRRAKLAKAFPEIDKQVAAFMERSHVPGAAWGIIVDGELAHVGVAGYRELETKTPVRRDTVFRIASMTKSFTAMAIVKLRDDGKLSLDDAAERYVPELKALRYPSADSPRITIRHLLSHSEGFPEDNPWGDQQLAASEAEFSEMMRKGIPFSNPPGVAYEYSNYGFAILGRIVTNVSGKPYRQYIADAVLRPLGMASTTLEPSAVAKDRIAKGYRWEDNTWKEEPPLPDGAFGAMGGMLTSLDDLGRYVGAFLAAYPPRDGPETAPIRRASLREMQQIARAIPASAIRSAEGAPQLNAGGYGYGLRVSQTCAFNHIVAHGGGLPGFGTLMQWLPDYGVGIIAFGNLTYTGWGRVFGAALESMTSSGGLKPRAAQPSAALVEMRDAVSRLINTWSDADADRIAAMNLYRDRSKDRRRQEIAALKDKAGQCGVPAAFDSVENALRGQWTMRCEKGDLRVSITLAPTIPPRVQFLSVTPVAAGAPPAGPPPACRM